METIHLRIEKKGRRGKTVTVLQGFTRHADEIGNLARRIKSICGAGGTTKEGGIEIQGDFRKQASTILRELGFWVKGS